MSEGNIRDTLRQIRLALLEADVALPVVKKFIETVKQDVIGSKIEKSLSPGQAFTKIIHNKLIELLGSKTSELNLKRPSPIVIMLVGLQGSGKTTTAAKLAKRLIDREKKRVSLVSVDIHRPAAILQLNRLAKDIGADFFNNEASKNPRTIVSDAIKQSHKSQADVVIIDTAGRLHVDDSMMAEMDDVYQEANPAETLFVVDSMAGQDVINPAQAFNEKLELTGLILTKADGDARGGVALSISHITGKPILYLGVGEKIDNFELFHPERMASRILGMGDVLTLVEKAQKEVELADAEVMQKKLQEATFDFNDFVKQMRLMKRRGSLGG